MSDIREAERKILDVLKDYGHDSSVTIPALLGATAFYLSLFRPGSRERVVRLVQEWIPEMVDEEAALPWPMVH